MDDYIYIAATRCVEKCDTRDPYIFMDKMGIDYKKTYVYPKNGLKGYSSIMNRSMYVRVC